MNYFDEYVSKYDKKDPDINYKYHHSYRVMNIMELLATKLNLPEKDIYLAKIIGLLHDIGRFEQDKLYNSFNDKVLEHGDYGEKILKENNFLSKFNIKKEDYQIVYKSVKNHNKFLIEDNLTERELFFTKLIRDADKLDILSSLGKEKYKKILLQDDKPISKEIEYSFYQHQLCNKSDVKSHNDGLILIFSYIYDINYKETYEIIYQEKYYDKIMKRIINKEIFKDYLNYTNKYIKERID